MAPKTILKRFDPPANLKDLKSDKALQAWSDTISGWMDEEIAGGSEGRTPLKQFFNGTKTPYDQAADPVRITWIGFPKRVRGNDETRWKKADESREVQDEYLEWSVLRDQQSNVQSVTYTCEGPEYWEHLGSNQPDDTLALIKQLNKPYLDKATMDWFFKKDAAGKWEYDRTNQYNNKTNTGIIINLFQRNNTLSAEVDIAAQGTVIRRKNGKIVTDKDELITCSKYGNKDRNSDPKIGSDINAAARKGWTLSVANPVALYMQSFDTSNLYLDTSGNRDGTIKAQIPDSWISLQGRGSGLGSKNPMALRLRIRNETGQKTADESRLLDVSDIWDDGTQNNIRYGAQFADLIQLGVAGVLGEQGQVADALPCYEPPKKKPPKAEAASVIDDEASSPGSDNAEENEVDTSSSYNRFRF